MISSVIATAFPLKYFLTSLCHWLCLIQKSNK